MTATAVQYLGAITTSGTVTAIAPDGSTVAIQTQAGQALTFATSAAADLIAGLQLGEGVQVTYSRDASGLLIPHALQILGSPGPAPTGPPTPPVQPTG